MSVAQKEMKREVYFYDPVAIGFNPAALDDSTDKPDEGVTLREVWHDDLARTLWLGVKARHLTSQFFRKECIEVATALRKSPPVTPNEIRHLPAVASYSDSFGGLRAQLWPYIVRVLIDEGSWGEYEDLESADQKISRLTIEVEKLRNPKREEDCSMEDEAEWLDSQPNPAFVPWIIPKSVAAKQLRWVYRDSDKPSLPHPWQNSLSYASLMNCAGWDALYRCSLCDRHHGDPIHVYGPTWR